MRPGTGAALDAAIARRNLTWVRWQDARDWLAAARETGSIEVRARLGEANAAQHDYEHAARDLVRARVHFRAGVPA